MTNSELINKALNRRKVYLIISIVLIVLSVVGIFLINSNLSKPKTVPHLEDMMKTTKASGKAHLNLSSLFKIADVIGDASVGYYIGFDKTTRFNYLLYMKVSDFRKYENKIKNKEKVHVVGRISSIPVDVKPIILEVYNEDHPDNKQKYVENIVGKYLLNLNYEDDSAFYYAFPIVFIGVGIFMLVMYGIGTSKSRNVLEKYMNEIDIISHEIENPDTIRRGQIYLTKNYIVDLGITFNIAKIEDIVWVYPYRIYRNLMNTHNLLYVRTKDNGLFAIQPKNIFAKKQLDDIEELIGNIVSANPKVLVGYNTENKNKMRTEYNIK